MSQFERTDATLRPKLAAWRAWLPSRGSVLLVALAASALLIYVRVAGAVPASALSAASTSIIPYQGRLADTGGNALTGSYAMTFRLYAVPSSGSALWTESWSGGNSVAVTNGLFNVALGSLTSIPASTFANNSSLWLSIQVGADSEMTPRVQLGSAPFAMRAYGVRDGGVTTAALADGAVTSRKLDAAEAFSYVDTQEVTTSTTPVSLGLVDIVTITLESTQWVDNQYGATANSLRLQNHAVPPGPVLYNI